MDKQTSTQMFRFATLKVTLARESPDSDNCDEASWTSIASAECPTTEFIFTRGSPILKFGGFPSSDMIEKFCSTFHPDRFKVEMTHLGSLEITHTLFEGSFEEVSELYASYVQKEAKTWKDNGMEEDYEAPSCGVTEVYEHFYDKMVEPWEICVSAACRHLKKIKAIEGEKCPITHEELNEDCIEMPCKHYISEEGFVGLVKAAPTAMVKCPLCRAEFPKREVIQ